MSGTLSISEELTHDSMGQHEPNVSRMQNLQTDKETESERDCNESERESVRERDCIKRSEMTRVRDGSGRERA